MPDDGNVPPEWARDLAPRPRYTPPPPPPPLPPPRPDPVPWWVVSLFTLAAGYFVAVMFGWIE